MHSAQSDRPPPRHDDMELDDVTTMVRCSDCDHMVPEINLTIHHATACQGRARPVAPPTAASSTPATPPPTHGFCHGAVDPHLSTLRHRWNATRTALASAVPTEAAPTTQQQQTPVASPDRKLPATRRYSSNEVIDLMDDRHDDDDSVQVLSPTGATATATTSHNGPSSSEDAEEWACPRCTLLNPKTAPICNACQYTNHQQQTTNGVRAPDPSFRESLLQDDRPDYFDSSFSPSPSSVVGSGALFGSMLGAAGAYARGRSVPGGALEGAVTGALGGAVLSQVLSPPSTRQQEQPASRRAAAHLDYSSRRQGSFSSSSSSSRTPRVSFNHRTHDNTTLSHSNNDSNSIPTFPPSRHRPRPRPVPRSSFRVVRSNSGGVLETLLYDSPHGMAHSLSSPQELMRMMLLQQHFAVTGAGPNVDRMSYDEMLQMFGDGTENLGADESTIRALPVVKVDETPLPDDKKQCLVCLEDFVAGEERKILPCLHGFHKECCDKWLRTNGSCPVCKHTVK